MGPADTWNKMAHWMRQLGNSFGRRPKAILVISAHWEERCFTIGSGNAPPLIYDYYGFPEHTYNIQYGAPGAPELAQQLKQLLDSAGVESECDPRRGYDHGVFIPFKLIYPDADIPILQISLKAGLDPQQHLRLGELIAPLRRQEVLIAGSGMSFHNMDMLMDGESGNRSDIFDEWLTESCALPNPQRSERLINWQTAPCARTAHPREEHLLPLMVVAGSAEGQVGRRIFSDRVMGAAVSAYQFG